MSSGIIVINEDSKKSPQKSPTNDNERTEFTPSKKRKLTEPNLNLGLSLRDEIIKQLNRMSGQLVSKINCRKEMIKINKIINERIMALSTDSEDRKSEDEDLSAGPFFELDSSTRVKIINQLMENLTACVEGSESERKRLVRENNNMINLLLNLKVKPYKLFNVDIDDYASGDRLVKRIKMIDKFNEFTHLLNASKVAFEGFDQQLTSLKVKTESYDELTHQMEKTDARIRDLEKQLKDIDKLKVNNDTKSDKVSFSFKLKGIKGFLDGKGCVSSKDDDYVYCKESDCVTSKVFNYASVNWYLTVKPGNMNKEKCIGFYLNTDEKCVIADFDLKLFYPDDDDFNYVQLNRKKFLTSNGDVSTSSGVGCSNFIGLTDLAGYIKDDTIELGVMIRRATVYKFKSESK